LSVSNVTTIKNTTAAIATYCSYNSKYVYSLVMQDGIGVTVTAFV